MAASPPVFESQYLQHRMREKKAENARVSLNSQTHDRTHPARRTTSGRDDIIFADNTSPPQRRSSARLYQSSPAGPITSASQRSSHGRHASNSVSATSSGRMMGAREIEDHVDKLSKQNFDLKLEVYHRREKIEELEKKLEELPQLKDDNAELLEVNEDLLRELDKRDQAIDEALVVICDLEDKVQMLQVQLGDTTVQKSEGRADADVIIETPQAAPARSGSKRREQDPSRLSVSPEVSHRMAELSATSPAQGGHRRMPSFLNSDHSEVPALRSHLFDRDQGVRPVQSYSTLGSQSITQEQEDLSADLIRSPALSELSESDFKSLYGRDNRSSVADDNMELDNEPRHSQADESSTSERSRIARTNKWVHDSALPPSEQSQPPSQARQRSSQPPKFQSLGKILHDSAPIEASVQFKERKQHLGKARSHEDSKPLHPLALNPVFGQNVLPPTPDTMHTRDTRPSTGPSNQSSSSIIADKCKHDSPATPTNGLLPQSFDSEGRSLRHAAQTFLSRSLLPREVEAFGSDADADVSSPGLGKPLDASSSYVEGYASDGLERSRGVAERQPRPRRDHGFDVDVLRHSLPPSSSFNAAGYPMRQRPSSSRRQEPMDIHGASIALEDRLLPRRRSISATPTQQLFLESQAQQWDDSNHESDKPLITTSPDEGQSRMLRVDTHANHTSHSSGVNTGTPRQSQRHAQPQTQHMETPPRPPQHGGAGRVISVDANGVPNTPAVRPTDSLRQRVSKFARRNSQSNRSVAQPSDNTSTTSTSFHTPPTSWQQSKQPLSPNSTPSLSRRTRQLFHRRGGSGGGGGKRTSVDSKVPVSSHSPPASPTHPPKRGHGRQNSAGAHDDDVLARSRVEGSSAFMDAAKAAAPRLDLVGNPKGASNKGIVTGIPIPSIRPQSP